MQTILRNRRPVERASELKRQSGQGGGCISGAIKDRLSVLSTGGPGNWLAAVAQQHEGNVLIS
ncbi:hypothetical protein K2Y11_00335 [bacterium]|nr:hypothetical protein [bacterium]